MVRGSVCRWRSSRGKSRRRQTALRGQARSALPGERTATMSHVAPQKPLRAARRLVKTTGSTSSRSDGVQQATQGENRDSLEVGATVGSRVVPVSAWLAERAAQAGDGSTHSHVFMGHRSAARGPIQSQRGRVEERLRDAAGQRDCSGSKSHSFAAARCVHPACPS
jgi:hypothetical protein